MPDTPYDPLPAMRAEHDQALMGDASELGGHRGYFEAFVAEGFTERQALYLTTTQLLQEARRAARVKPRLP